MLKELFGVTDEIIPGNTYAQRLKLLYLKDIFLKYTNDNQALTRTQIEEKLEEFGVSEGRKAFAEDIEALRAYGMDIQATTGRTASYQLSSREFELAELKLLADAVGSSKFLTVKQSADLLEKIESLCSEGEAREIHRNVFVTGRPKQPNKAVLYNIDTIHRAIAGENGKFKIAFKYFEYDVNKKKKYRDKPRKCSPYALVWDRDHYYLVAWNDHRECYSNYRVDRMESVRITEEPAKPLEHDFDLASYVTTHISMFSGEETEVKLYCDKSIVNAVLDKFGMNVRIIPDNDGEHFTVFLNVVTKAPFYAWVFQFGGKATVVAPDEIREEYLDMLRNASEFKS